MYPNLQKNEYFKQEAFEYKEEILFFPKFIPT